MERRDFLLRAAAATRQATLFPLGVTSITATALERLHSVRVWPSHLIRRHHAGDWGDVDDADHAMNEEGLQEGGRLFSSYEIEEERFWVLTTADRARTILFLPGDPPDPPPADLPQQGARDHE